MKKGILKKALVLVIMGVLLLSGCGSKNEGKEVDGYWLCTSAKNGEAAIYIIIDDSHAEYYTNWDDNGVHPENYRNYQGTVEKTEEGADVYISEFAKFSPLHVKKSEDGSKLFMTSDNDNWPTLVFDQTDKETYEADIDDGILSGSTKLDQGAATKE